MMYCPNCNKELEDGVMFCDGCGAQITVDAPAAEVETVFCPNCGQQTDAAEPYCQNCGSPIGEVAPAPAKKGLPKKALLFGGIAVAAIAAIVVAVILIFGGGRNNDYVAYFKDGELWFNDFSDESLEVTNKLLDYEGATKEALSDASNYSYMVKMTADGKTMFFPDKYDGKDFTIYYRDVTDADSSSTKIDSGIYTYGITEKGDKIVYMKDAEYKRIGDTGVTLATIKIGALDDVVKVASDATLVAVNSSYDTVIYRTAEEGTKKDGDVEYKVCNYTYYLWQDGEKTKICSGEISSFNILDKRTDDGYKNLSKVCYVKDENLYTQEIGEDAVKVDKEVSYIASIYDSGDIYYVKNGKELKYIDYINNDNDTELSDEQKKETFGHTQSLYCYSDEESVLVAENYDQGYFADDEAVAIIWTKKADSLKKVKLSEVGYYWEATSKILNEYYDLDTTINILADGALNEIDIDDVNDYTMTDDGSEIYFFCLGYKEEKDEDGNVISREQKEKGEIKLVTVKKGTVSAPEEYDTDVNKFAHLNRNDELVYYKDYNSEKNKATLVIAQEEIDSDVKPGSVTTLGNGTYVYWVDYNSDSDKQCGTLKIYKKGEATVIADDVYDYVATPDGEVLYLLDYNTEKCRGELYRYNGGKNEKMDEDVTAILDIYVWEED